MSSQASVGNQPFQLSPQPRQPGPSNRMVIGLPLPCRSMTLRSSLPQKLPLGDSEDQTARDPPSAALPSPAGASAGRYWPLTSQSPKPSVRQRMIRNDRRPSVIAFATY